MVHTCGGLQIIAETLPCGGGFGPMIAGRSRTVRVRRIRWTHLVRAETAMAAGRGDCVCGSLKLAPRRMRELSAMRTGIVAPGGGSASWAWFAAANPGRIRVRPASNAGRADARPGLDCRVWPGPGSRVGHRWPGLVGDARASGLRLDADRPRLAARLKPARAKAGPVASGGARVPPGAFPRDGRGVPGRRPRCPHGAPARLRQRRRGSQDPGVRDRR